MGTTIRWLHLTDLHVGIDNGDWLWPNMQDKFHEDLERIREAAGPWDLVLFTGDLVQKGIDYGKFEEVLGKIWGWFKELGCDPKLLAVPGNHDLQRPKPPLSAAAEQLEEWSQKPHVQQRFWDDPEGEHRKVVKAAFEQYDKWWRNTPLKPDGVVHGILPGDFSYSFEKGGFRLGIVGLNAAFLQLTDKQDYQGRLALHPRQFHKACAGNGVEWANHHHACFLMTHHPPDWLGDDCRNLV
jgi:hypothetical protein